MKLNLSGIPLYLIIGGPKKYPPFVMPGGRVIQIVNRLLFCFDKTLRKAYHLG